MCLLISASAFADDGLLVAITAKSPGGLSYVFLSKGFGIARRFPTQLSPPGGHWLCVSRYKPDNVLLHDRFVNVSRFAAVAARKLTRETKSEKTVCSKTHALLQVCVTLTVHLSQVSSEAAICVRGWSQSLTALLHSPCQVLQA